MNNAVKIVIKDPKPNTIIAISSQ